MSDEAEIGALRPNMRPLLTAVLLNVLLALGLLGWPYYRGRERAGASAHAVVELSACLLDGRPRATLGLALPLGERERFATLYEGAPEDWPGRCRPLVAQVGHEPATFVLPSAKAAELDLSEAIEDLETALLDLESARRLGRGAVPEEPLEALGRVRGMVAALLLANDLEIEVEAVGLDLGPIEETLPAPSRVPLRTGAGFFYADTREGVVLRVVAADGVGIAEVEVEPPATDAPARVRVLQLRRPGGARGVLVGPDDAWLAWTTPETTCETDERHCAMRATGLGRLLEGSRVMRPEFWIAAHPAGAIERSIVVADARFTMVARTPEGGFEARVFERGEPIPPPPPNERPEPPPPVQATATRVVEGVRDWVLRDGGAFVLRDTEAGRDVLSIDVTDPLRDLVSGAPEGAEILEGCGHRIVAFGPRSAQVVGEAVAWPTIEHHARVPMRGPSPAESSIHLACDASGVVIGVLEQDGTLVVHRCAEGACSSTTWPITHVEAFDVVLHEGNVWVASSGGEDSPQIRVGRLDATSEPRVAGACWSSGHGMCGPGRWASGVHAGLVLTARDGSDALALGLDGEDFVGLPGLTSGL